MSYKIYFSDDSMFKGDNPYGCYLGKVHRQSRIKNSVNYPSCTDEESHPKIKIYKTYNRASKAAQSVLNECYDVKSFEIIEINK